MSSGNTHLDLLLRDLPYAEVEQPAVGFLELSGVLTRAEPGRVRIAIVGYCLTFDSSDVEDVVEVPTADENSCAPGTVRLLIRRPARLWSVEPWTELDQATFGVPRPFTFAVRPHPIVAPPNADFRAREQSFLRSIE